ncbi:hypothetical protein [Granulicella tundricola]|uniref:Uncharacterized protein n=1 Tax=Granulicella tundricola (strain ATCC BAA-1859 / DSM 23138 / MP5ACTX9) TaxID=1198114 RepID=E8X4S8_GRATM|nr:hypothetical protein [Granulicella tundricola]ADW70567.1 hypothetical protein AciX9_3563 [Granulicella tundricola MP5ACTX9]
MKRWFGLAFSGAALATGVGFAQTHVVKKPETVVRAVGVYEWTGELGKAKASRFVPVTVFIDNELQDAGFYLARPVPFALQTGTIFELDKAGVPDGTLELAYQRHLTGGVADLDGGWLGYGAYKAPPVMKASTKKSGALSKVEVSGGKSESSGPKFGKTPDASSKDPDRPTMRRKTDSDDTDTTKSASTSTPASTPTSPDDPNRPTMKRKTDSDTAASATPSSTASTPEDDPDRPTMKRKTDSDTASTPATSTPADDSDRPTMKRKSDSDSTTDSTDSKTSADSKTSTDSAGSGGENDPERPTLRKRTDAQRQGARKEHDSSSVTGVGSLNDDPDRPNLHRGKPAGRMNEDDLPPLQGTPADMQQLVAVSDAKNRDTHDFARAWADDAERTAVLGKMQAMARDRLTAYGDAAAKAAAAPAAAAKTAHAHAHAPVKRAAVKKPVVPASAAVALNDEVLKGFTLSYGGAATYFYTASTPGADGTTRYVTVVAQLEPAGDLKAALASVTDSTHLDRSPWMRLVDAVDVEASNRASLLLELRAQHSRQFALYRVIGAQAEQRFLTGSTE